MLTIYSTAESLYCTKLRILLVHKNVPRRELLPPGGYGSDEYKKYVPSGNLPALVDGDLVIGDSEAIAEYLNERYPDPPMLPDDLALRAKVRERSRFHDTRLEPELRVLFPLVAPANRDAAVSQAQSEKISGRLRQLSRLLQEKVSAPDQVLELDDCGFPICFAWIEALTPVLGLAVEWPDAVVSYRAANARHPTIEKVMADYRPVMDGWLKTRTAA